MYELMVISSGLVDSDQLLSKVEKVLKDAQVSNVISSKLGKRRLAYPIAKQTEAEYLLFNFEAEGDKLATISESLRLEQEDLLRYLIIRVKPQKAAKKTAKAKPVDKAEKRVEKTRVVTETKKLIDIKSSLGKKVPSKLHQKSKNERKLGKKV